eukprot:jgi/Chlat1/4556/Chrsp29S04461
MLAAMRVGSGLGLENRLEKLRQERDEARINLSSHQQMLVESQSQNAKLQAQLDEIQAVAIEQKEEVGRLKTLNGSLETQRLQLNANLQAANAAKHQLEGELQTAITAKESAEQAGRTALEHLTLTEQRVSELEATIHALQEADEKLRKECAEATRARGIAEQTTQSLQTRNNEISQQCDQLKGDLKAAGEAKELAEKAGRQVSELEVKKELLQAVQLTLQKERDEAMCARETADKEKAELQQRLNTAVQTTQAEMQARLDAAEETTQNYSKFLQANILACHACEQRLLASEGLISSLREQLYVERDEVRHLNGKLTEVHTDRSTLQSKLTRLHADHQSASQLAARWQRCARRFRTKYFLTVVEALKLGAYVLHLQQEQSDKAATHRLLVSYIEDDKVEALQDVDMRHVGPFESLALSLKRFVSALSPPSTPRSQPAATTPQSSQEELGPLTPSPPSPPQAPPSPLANGHAFELEG